jgi:hypothetical protein
MSWGNWPTPYEDYRWRWGSPNVEHQRIDGYSHTTEASRAGTTDSNHEGSRGGLVQLSGDADPI